MKWGIVQGSDAIFIWKYCPLCGAERPKESEKLVDKLNYAYFNCERDTKADRMEVVADTAISLFKDLINSVDTEEAGEIVKRKLISKYELLKRLEEF